MNQSLGPRYDQHRNRQPNQPRYVCFWCKGPRKPSHADGGALFNHVQTEHGEQYRRLQSQENFDKQTWFKNFKARALQNTGQPQPQRRQDRQETKQNPQVRTEPSSTTSSQEFGIQGLSLTNQDSRKRSPTRKGEPSGGDDPGGTRSGVKRTKTAETSSPSQSPQQAAVRSPRGSTRNQRRAPMSGQRKQAHPSFSGPQATMGQPRGLPLDNPVTAVPQASSRGNDTAHSRESVVELPDRSTPKLYLQPDSRPISQEQLAAEVKSIYSGLTMVEAKCIHVDKAQAAAIRSAERGESELIDDHWKALIALHRTLLHEHHDFFLASQHPSASPALRRLAAKYSMPARMWKHGIHSFLELLRYRLPDSLEYMVSFIYFAYQMMSLLYETVPAFEDTWIECLGDLGRYRMAIEDEDFRDRETWAGVARFWYSKAADRSPGTGRLYHHLAILARPNALQQLYLYSRSLTCLQPFQSARDSITTLFDPIITSSDTTALPISRIDTFYIKLHSILCLRRHLEDFDAVLSNFLELLGSHITRSGTKWREEGSYIAISTIAALFEYGSPESILRRLVEHGNFRLRQQAQAQGLGGANSTSGSSGPSPSLEPNFAGFLNSDLSRIAFYHGLNLLFLTTESVLRRRGDKAMPIDKNVLPFVNIVLTFALTLASIQSFNFPYSETYVTAILDGLPWEELCFFMNTYIKTENFSKIYENAAFLRPEKGDIGPLPEDHFIRGQVWTQCFFPSDWWKQDGVDDEERSIELASTLKCRSERVFWIMCRLSSYKKWIYYDPFVNQWRPLLRQSARYTSVRLPKIDIVTDAPAEEDVDMADDSEPEADDEAADASDVSEDDSSEMLKLRRANRNLTAQQRIASHVWSSSPTQLAVSPGGMGSASLAKEMMPSGFTVMVCDEGALLNQQGVFKSLVDGGWPVVVPGSAIVGLLQLSTGQDPKRPAADGAILSIRTAVNEGKDVRIVDNDGTDITGKAFSNGKPIHEEPLAKEDQERILIGITRQASDMSNRGIPRNVNEQAKPAVLVTESRATRIKAKYEGVAAVATSMLRNVLQASLTTRSLSGSSAGRHSPKPGPVLATM